jgi:hypothetical protein
MANRDVILSLSKDPLTSIPFDRLTTPLSLGGKRKIKVRDLHRQGRILETHFQQRAG